MKWLIVLLAVLNGINADLSYTGRWYVKATSETPECCYPAKNSVILVEHAGPNNMTILMFDGEWSSACEQYGWQSGTTIPVPWDDSTLIIDQIGVSAIYKNIKNDDITWDYVPEISELTQDGPFDSEGEKLAEIRMRQKKPDGSKVSCWYIIGSGDGVAQQVNHSNLIYYSIKLSFVLISLFLLL